MSGTWSSVAQTDWTGGNSYYSSLEEGQLNSCCALQSLNDSYHSWKLLVCESYSQFSGIRLIFLFFLKNAMVPNGVLVNNSAINAKTSAFLDYVLTHQDSTGWLGPEVGTSKPRYLWGRYALLAIGIILYVFNVRQTDIRSCLVRFR